MTRIRRPEPRARRAWRLRFVRAVVFFHRGSQSNYWAGSCHWARDFHGCEPNQVAVKGQCPSIYGVAVHYSSPVTGTPILLARYYWHDMKDMDSPRSETPPGHREESRGRIMFTHDNSEPGPPAGSRRPSYQAAVSHRGCRPSLRLHQRLPARSSLLQFTMTLHNLKPSGS